MKNKPTSIFLLLLFALSFHTLSGQKRWWASSISGQGPVVEQELAVASFERISLGVSANVYVKRGDRQTVTVEGQQNIIDNLRPEVDDKTWRIRFDRPVRRSQGLKIYITLPYLSGARISGSGNIQSEDSWTAAEFQSGISGSGNLNVRVQAQELSAKVSGSGNMQLGGTADHFYVQISGSGNVRAQEVAAKHCQVRISGSGDAKVDVAEQLEVRISGSGDVSYSGRPRVSSKISGSGDLSSM